MGQWVTGSAILTRRVRIRVSVPEQNEIDPPSIRSPAQAKGQNFRRLFSSSLNTHTHTHMLSSVYVNGNVADVLRNSFAVAKDIDGFDEWKRT